MHNIHSHFWRHPVLVILYTVAELLRWYSVSANWGSFYCFIEGPCSCRWFLRACVSVYRLLPLLLSSNQYDVLTAYQLLLFFPNPHHSHRLTTTPNLITSMLRHVTGLYMDGSGRRRIPNQNRNRTWTRRQIPNPISRIVYVARSRVRKKRCHLCSLRHRRS